MRIDPSQLSEPLAHVLSAGATGAADGQRAAAAGAGTAEAANVDRLDQMLLRRLRAQQASSAATNVLAFQDAQVRVQQLQELMARDLDALRSAQGPMDSSRVRGLLGD